MTGNFVKKIIKKSGLTDLFHSKKRTQTKTQHIQQKLKGSRCFIHQIVKHIQEYSVGMLEGNLGKLKKN